MALDLTSGTGGVAPNSLLDTIRKNSAQLAGAQVPATNNTQGVQQLLAAKSGKAGAAGIGNLSSVGEQAANSQTQQTLQETVAPQIAIQQGQTDVQAAQQEASARQQSAQIAQSRKFDTAQNQIQVQQLLQGLSQDRGNLQTQENQARLEQTSFLLSMQDKQYVQNLQLVGQKQRLDQAAQFQEEQQKLAFGSSLDLVKQQLGVQNLLATGQIDYNDAISRMSVEQAIQIADLERKDAANAAQTQMDLARYGARQQAALSGIQAQGQGLQSLVQAGTQAAAAAASQPGTPADTSTAQNPAG